MVHVLNSRFRIRIAIEIELTRLTARMMRPILAAVLLLAATVCMFHALSDTNRVILGNVRTLTFDAGKNTVGRRYAPEPQMQLKRIDSANRNTLSVKTPTAMTCLNTAYGSTNPTWQCSALLETDVHLGKTEVVCEGYNGSDDPYVALDTCFIEYELLDRRRAVQQSTQVKTSIQSKPSNDHHGSAILAGKDNRIYHDYPSPFIGCGTSNVIGIGSDNTILRPNDPPQQQQQRVEPKQEPPKGWWASRSSIERAWLVVSIIIAVWIMVWLIRRLNREPQRYHVPSTGGSTSTSTVYHDTVYVREPSYSWWNHWYYRPWWSYDHRPSVVVVDNTNRCTAPTAAPTRSSTVYQSAPIQPTEHVSTATATTRIRSDPVPDSVPTAESTASNVTFRMKQDKTVDSTTTSSWFDVLSPMRSSVSHTSWSSGGGSRTIGASTNGSGSVSVSTSSSGSSRKR